MESTMWMRMVSCSFQMAVDIRDHLKMETLRESESLYMQMDLGMRVTGDREHRMGLVF